MAISLSSANVDNYPVGKGIVSVKLAGTGAFVDIGDVSAFEITPNLEKLDHFSSRTGVKEKDRSIVLSKGATLRMVMSEGTPFNMGIMLMAVPSIVSGVATLELFGANTITAAVQFIGTNEIGPKWDIHLPRVDFAPSKSYSPLSEEWLELETEGEIISVAGSFGTLNSTFTDVIPVNVVLPQIISDGTPAVGETLTVYPGAWTGSPATYTYVWKNATVAIPGATNSYYVPVAGDSGDSITVTVTATNGGGAASATSPAVVIA